MIDKLLDEERIALGQTPTPLEEVPALADFLGGDVVLKRDDKLDELGCGHKLRSLEYLLPFHRSQGKDTIVTFGSIRSNHTKAVAISCAKLGIPCHALIGGDTFQVPHALNGSCLLTALSGATLHWCERTTWNEMPLRAEECVRSLKRDGKNPALISPLHGTYPGLLGFVRLGLELREQIGNKEDVSIIAHVGTGSLVAGLALANAICGFRWKILGVCLTLNAEAAMASTNNIIESLGAAHPEFFPASTTALAPLHYVDNLAYREYDRFDSMTLAATKDLFAKTGILFEPNYMLKCCFAAKELFHRGIISSTGTSVLLHTGGHFSMLDLPEPLRPTSPLVTISSSQ